jgi:S-DNA-T family DNA segregation ATPase FtsK/SpoIIIE
MKAARGKQRPSAKMAAKAKVSAKPRGKRKGKDEDDEAPKRAGEIPGLILLAVLLVTFVSLVAEQVQASGNILGPWVGSRWANLLNSGFGKLPVLFYLAALAFVGVQLVFKTRLWKQAAISGGIGLLLALLLSIRHIGDEGLVYADYQVTGGWLGNFLAQRIFQPVFGAGHFGPYLVTTLLIFILVVWAFQISVAAWVKRGAHVTGVMARTMAEGWRSAERPHVPGLESVSSVGVDVDEEDEEFVERPKRGRGKKAVASANAALIPTAEDSPEEEQAKLEALLESGNLEGLDPLTIRKLRDLALERQRVTELNDWEEKTRRTEIGGLLRPRPAAEAADMTPDEDIPVKGSKRKASKAKAPEPADDEVSDAEASGASEDRDPPFDLDEEEEGGFSGDQDVVRESPVKAALVRNPPSTSSGTAKGRGEGLSAQNNPTSVPYEPYQLPNLDSIFPEPPDQPLEFTEEELLEQKQLLEAQLNNFKVRGTVTGIHPGPVITRYEVELAPGEKVNRISGLADDLALALRAKSIRILAPIPGKSLVGVEVPNRKPQIVYIKEILDSERFRSEDDGLKVALGKTIAGEPYAADLTRAPHLLIAGQTGSGKSVCINSIMASLLASKKPDDLRMILIDPKVVELKPYESIPHLLGDVITNPETAVQALKWATIKMDERYEKLAKCGVRNIKGFNEKARAGTLREEARYSQGEEFGEGAPVRYTDDVDAGTIPLSEPMPYILIVIDELADLMMVAGKEVETSIARIAQKARAVGIHLILATQRPSTNVITGTIKANLPTRIAFKVASQIDARTILDKQGAEQLLGRGDMLFRPIESPDPERLHGCFLDDKQCEDIAEACASQRVNYPKVRTFNVDEEIAGAAGEDEERDEKFIDAAELVVSLKQASVSLLQRRLGVGYAKAGRIVDQLERAGIVGRERGSKPREVLMDEDQLQGFLRSHEATEGL